MSTRTLLKHVSWFVSAWAIATLFMVGCHSMVYQHTNTRPHPVYTSSRPPEAQSETPSPQPGEGQVWVAGHWHWSEVDSEVDGVWQWHSGSWVPAPKDGSVPVEATYEQRGDVWVYTAPYWRRPGEPDSIKPYPARSKESSKESSTSLSAEGPEVGTPPAAAETIDEEGEGDKSGSDEEKKKETPPSVDE